MNVEDKARQKGRLENPRVVLECQRNSLFRGPAGAQVKVRYGVGWFGKDRQKQTLSGTDYKRLSVGGWSVTRARRQIRVKESGDVTYDVIPGGVALSSPEVSFWILDSQRV